MRNCKLSITIALFCSFIANPSKAFFPTYDFSENPFGINVQVVKAGENLSEMQVQITEMSTNLTAIGDAKGTMLSFDDNSFGDDTKESAENVNITIGTTFAINISVQDKIRSASENVNEAHKSIINTMVSQVEKEMKIALDEVSTYIKLAQNDKDASFIEENEEEITDINKEKEEMQKYFTAMKNENSQLYAKMNDLFDSSINIMNKSSDLSYQALARLEKNLTETKEIVGDEKNQLQAKATELLKKDQENSDLTISLMEDIQNKYSKQYQEKIVDNINNYQKMAQAYIEGNITSEELREAGNALRAEADKLIIFDDRDVFAVYNEESANIKASAEALTKEIKQIWKNKVQKS